jgi:hypothetical protein
MHCVDVLAGEISQCLQERNEKVDDYPNFLVDQVFGRKSLFLLVDITVIDRCNQHEHDEEDVAISHIFQSLSLSIGL